MPDLGEITRLLSSSTPVDRATSERLVVLLRDELRTLAAGMMRSQPAGHTLQATALVNEMYLRLASSESLAPESRTHFLAIAARAMRQILARHAADRRALKRGGAFGRVSFVGEPSAEVEADSLALDAALAKLTALDERQAQVIEMRFFANMSMSEVAECLSISISTVEREWRMARAWMRAEMAQSDGTQQS